MVRRLALFLALLLTSAHAPTRLSAQVGGPLQPPTTGGLPVLLQELRMLGHNKRVLMIGAHPDDEDTQLLVMLTRREGAEAGYLALNRGEGGQNLIGPELGEALGILRTEELMAARNVDGAQQFFTRAYDFGFSKTLDDTWAHWPKDSVLKDVVRIIRRFRPQVIVSVFSGTPRDGHGQHQAAGWAAQEAYKIAGDPKRFPELATEEGLQPWTPTKLYIEAWFNPSAATLTVDGGEVEKISGKTYHQLAMAARSLHRSQDMGNLQEFGPSPSRLTFAAVRGGTADVGEGWAGFWSGVDTVLKAPPEHFAALAEARAAAGRDPVAVGTALERADVALARRGDGKPQSLVQGAPDADYRDHLIRARSTVAWLFVDGTAGRSRVAPGDSVEVVYNARNAGSVTLRYLNWLVLTGEVVGSPDPGTSVTLAPGASSRYRVEFVVPTSSRPSTPTYLIMPRSGDTYQWPAEDHDLRWAARDGDAVRGGIFGSTNGSILDAGPLAIFSGATERIRDQAFGEVRRPVVVVPRIGVKLTPGVAVVRTGASGEARSVPLDIVLESGTPDETKGTLTVELPDGWARPTPVSFTMKGVGTATHIAMRVTVPASAAEGQYPIRAVAIDGAGKRYDIGAFTVEYPHIRSRQYTRPATARIEVIELTPPLARRVGYVRGAADRVPEALAGAGLTVTILDSTALGTADLSRYDAIVIGPRAYEVDSALIRNNDRLLDYAKNGGRLVVQYQQAVYLEGAFAPFMLGGNSRITDENAPVTMLGATPTQSALAPVFRTPNAIGPEDWTGWVQERALYCPTTWGQELNSLLSMKDPGEAATSGCLLEGKVGRGSYVYTGISFFRELPAGVPGAYRLFFNLLGGSVTP